VTSRREKRASLPSLQKWRWQTDAGVRATNVFFCAIKLSAKLVFLGNGILVIPFFDIGKWLFVLTLKSHLNNVLRVMFIIMRGNCYCPRPKKCVYFSYIPQGNLKVGYGLAYSFNKSAQVETSGIVFT